MSECINFQAALSSCPATLPLSRGPRCLSVTAYYGVHPIWPPRVRTRGWNTHTHTNTNLEGSDTVAIWQIIEWTAPQNSDGKTQHSLWQTPGVKEWIVSPVADRPVLPLISFPWRIDIILRADHMNRWMTCAWASAFVGGGNTLKRVKEDRVNYWKCAFSPLKHMYTCCYTTCKQHDSVLIKAKKKKWNYIYKSRQSRYPWDSWAKTSHIYIVKLPAMLF